MQAARSISASQPTMRAALTSIVPRSAALARPKFACRYSSTSTGSTSATTLRSRLQHPRLYQHRLKPATKVAVAAAVAVSSSSSSDTSSLSTSSSKYADFNASPSYRLSSSSRPHQRSKLNRTLFILGWIPVAAFITSHFVSLGNVTGGSMSPTFNGPYHIASAANSPSDVVLLNRTIKVQHNNLRAGDIVTLISPLDPRLLLTKRIIALPETQCASGSLQQEAEKEEQEEGGKAAGRWTRMKIPPGHVWVEGDAAVDIVFGSLERAANTPPSSPSSSTSTAVAGAIKEQVSRLTRIRTCPNGPHHL